MIRQYDILESLMNRRGKDSSGIIRAFDDIRKKMPGISIGIVNLIANNIRNVWMDDAINASAAWGEKYASTITVDPVTGDSGTARVYVDESVIDPRSGKPTSLFVNMMEDGVKVFSIKDGLMRSKRIKISSKGVKYLHVPFRWRTPKKGQKKSSIFTGVMSREVYDLVKSGQPVGEEYGHMAGMVRYEKAGHSQHFTFRTVTEKSQGWMYPGKEPSPVYPGVIEKVEQIINDNIDKLISAFKKVYDGKNF